MSLIEQFIRYITFEKRFSSHTIKAYASDLKEFHEYALNKTSSFDFIKTDERIIRDWIVSLMNNKINAKSIGRKRSSLSRFFKYLMRESLITANPIDKVSIPKVKKRLPVFVEEKNMSELLNEVIFPNNYEGIRDKVIIELFYTTGMRLSELINIRIFDINESDSNVKVVGKRNKERIIPILPELLENINKLKDLTKEKQLSNSENYLFLTTKGVKLYPRLVQRMINKYLSITTTLEKRSPHILRHTFATHMLNHGADINSIKEILGHANLSATQIYTHNTFDKLKNIYKQSHPRK